jgi:hypothetical protein
MPDYTKAKIFQLIDNTNNNIYIGTTSQKLCQILSGLVARYKKYCLCPDKLKYHPSFEIIKNKSYQIILIDNVVCINKEELHQQQRNYIDKMQCIKTIINK